MIDSPTPWLTGAVVLLSLVSTLSLALRRRKSDAELLFAVFCGSLAVQMLRPWVGEETGLLWWMAAVGSCATCNAYWLVARALFRGDGAVGRVHLAVALGMAVMIVGVRVASRSEVMAGDWVAASLGALLSLASSAVLALAFLEALRGWSGAMPVRERRLRVAFMLVFGGCVLVSTVVGGLADALPALRELEPHVVAGCALAILLYTQWALHERRTRMWPMQSVDALPITPEASPSTPTSEQRQLAGRILRLLERDEAYRQPDLKVADLATRLECAEHRVSRTITQVLHERNFNSLVNRYRIDHVCRALSQRGSARTLLEISMDAGFASLGPFNRAFKAALGCTPSAFREADSETQRALQGRLQPQSVEPPESAADPGDLRVERA